MSAKRAKKVVRCLDLRGWMMSTREWREDEEDVLVGESGTW